MQASLPVLIADELALDDSRVQFHGKELIVRHGKIFVLQQVALMSFPGYVWIILK